MRILVADDASSVRLNAEQMLKAQGHHVLLACDGLQAWELSLRHRPELIFCDAELPGIDGAHLHVLWREHPLMQSVPVVLLTERPGVAFRAQAQLLGITDTLAKPFSRELLLGVVSLCAAQVPAAPSVSGFGSGSPQLSRP